MKQLEDRQLNNRLSSSVNRPSKDIRSIPINSVYKPTEAIRKIKDLDIEPCFNIDKLVDCFIQQIDRISEMKSENTPMIGLFAPWGRGKSFFLKHVCEKLENGYHETDNGVNSKRKKCGEKYMCVSFNAWKYQDAPAIWAHLFKKMYQRASWWRVVFYWFLTKIWTRKTFVFLLAIASIWGVSYVGRLLLPILQSTSYIKFGIVGSLLTIVIAFLSTLNNQPQKVLDLIDKYTKKDCYTDYLGVQHEIETSIVSLLGVLAICRKKVILCVEDIDRCPQDTMIKILDSLRTILENDKIRDKLIIICCADIDKIKDAYNEYRKTDQSHIEIREQIDKWFIFSLGLAPLSIDHIKEYLSKILILESENAIPLPSLVDCTRARGSMTVQPLGQGDMALTDDEIYELIANYIGNMTPEELPTPRKIRILCHQIFFASTLCEVNDIRIPRNFFELLIKKSLTGESDYENDTALGDIIDMVVPY